MQRGVAADGSTYPFTVTVLHRDSMSSDPVTLATDGHGKVLLWDMTVPPGSAAPRP